MALFTDSGSPTFEADEVIRDWLLLSVDAPDSAPARDSSVSALEAAEVFLVTNLGAAFFGCHVRLNAPGTQRLRFVRVALAAAGVPHVDRHADEVLRRHATSLPPLDYSSLDAY